ncbi:hypothetical protein FS842_005518 [Serendipita sp. 407]|nr:hypothetical protein FS842_005518 [Serendipita sp. 407]
MDDEESIPKHLIRRIDRAFDTVLRSPQQQTYDTDELVAPRTVRRRRGEPATTAKNDGDSGGGFIPDSPPAGGFLIDDDIEVDQSTDEANPPAVANHLPLGLVPAALQLLDLPPADEEIMQVFRNAAGGWGGSNDAQSVSRKDFRSVCGILLADQMDDSPIPSDREAKEPEPTDDADEGGGDSTEDEYDDPDEFSDEDDSEDEYLKKSNQKPTKKKTASKRNVQESSTGQRSLTRRQKAACRDAFALFFPDVPDEDLESQRVGIKDIVRVSGLLKEKITAEEVMEMLGEYSTSPDKTMSYSDFQQMMISAKLA